MCPERPVLFADGVQPAGMVQGYLANSCLVSTANALIDWPRLLQNVFVGTGQEAQGRYCCKLYKNGDWKHIVVDDQVPCDLHGCVGLALVARGRVGMEGWGRVGRVEETTETRENK